MYCPRCDETLLRGMTVCPNCGGALVRQSGDRAGVELDVADAMDDRGRAKSILLYGIGALFLGIFIFAAISTEGVQSFGILLFISGYIMMVIAACYFARSKGYHAAVGLIVIVGLLGFIVVMVLPDKFKE